MLVLAREPGHSIMIGHDIKITVISVSEGLVRIGIAAPTAIDVHRDEIYREITDANIEAAASVSKAVSPTANGVAGGADR
jgi:carbon storage regulator